MDFAAEGLLDGLEGEDREARRRLLQRLDDDGFELSEMKAAVAEDRLALLPLERLLGGRYSARMVQEKTGLPAEVMRRMRRVAGLPEVGEDERVFGDEDIETARATRLFLDAGLSQQTISDMTRVLGESMARVAATTTAVFTDDFLQAGDSEDDVAERFAGLAEQLTPALEPVIVAAFKAHLREAIRRGVLSSAMRSSGRATDEQTIAVCFADLVGFTRLGGQSDARELGTVAGRLAEAAGELASPPVRLVKTIGDAAMLVSLEAAPLVDAALELVGAFDEQGLPPLRAGVAMGPAVQLTGDFYGHAVNLASRVTGIARPGSVLCSQEVHDACREEFRWSFAGRHRVKGVREPLALHRVRHLPDDGEAG